MYVDRCCEGRRVGVNVIELNSEKAGVTTKNRYFSIILPCNTNETILSIASEDSFAQKYRA